MRFGDPRHVVADGALTRFHQLIQTHHQEPVGLVAHLLTEPVTELHELVHAAERDGDVTADLLLEATRDKDPT